MTATPSAPVPEPAALLPERLMLIAHVPGHPHPFTATAEAAWQDANDTARAAAHLLRGGLVVTLRLHALPDGAPALDAPALAAELQRAARTHQVPRTAQPVTVTGQYDALLPFLQGAPLPERIGDGHLHALQAVTDWATGRSGAHARTLKGDPLVQRHLQDLVGVLAGRASPAGPTALRSRP